jgi:hypothetical protein
MEHKQLALLLSSIASSGAKKALDECGDQPRCLTKTQAYALYGRSNVDRWIAERLIEPQPVQSAASPGSLDRLALERIAAQSNRITYLPVAER